MANSDLMTDLAFDRTLLASERTLLAWYRTAFGAYGLALGFGGIVSRLDSTSAVAAKAYASFGICFALLGVAATVDGILRYQHQNQGSPDRFAKGKGDAARVIAAGVIIALLGLASAAMLLPRLGASTTHSAELPCAEGLCTVGELM